VVDERYWPHGTAEFLSKMDQQKVERPNFATLYQPYNEVLYWKSDASPELFEAMKKEWDLVTPPKNDAWISQALSEIPPEYVALVPDGDEVEYYINKEWLFERSGKFVVVLRNKTKNKFLVRHYFDF
jgi:hypothetical protein